MHNVEHNSDDPLKDLGYEGQDLHLPSIAKATSWFLIFVSIMYVAGLAVFWIMNPNVFNQAPANSQAIMTKVPASPNPLLQTNVTTKTDIMQLRQDETAQLTSSAILDAKKGVYRIPVDRAIELTAQRGLPQKPSADIVMGGK